MHPALIAGDLYNCFITAAVAQKHKDASHQSRSASDKRELFHLIIYRVKNMCSVLTAGIMGKEQSISGATGGTCQSNTMR